MCEIFVFLSTNRNNMKEVFKQRLKNARIITGLSMDDLAEKVGVSKQMISKYEAGSSIPDSTNLIKLSKALGRKPDYFFKPFTIELGAVEFRKKSSFSIKKQESIKKRILMLMENYIELEDILAINYSFINPIKNNKVTASEEAEDAANELRNKWKLGFDPIYNIVSLLEENEIKVIEIEENINAFDGMSCFVGNKFPVIVINKNFPIERKRLTLLHELAHLLLDIPNDCEGRKRENICHRFAGAMLLPEDIVIDEFGAKRKNITINEMSSIQKRFGISIPAIMYRLLNADIISEDRLQHFFIQLNKNADFKDEINQPRFIGDESSTRFHRLIYRALAQEFISMSKASGLIGQSIQQIRDNYSLV